MTLQNRSQASGRFTTSLRRSIAVVSTTESACYGTWYLSMPRTTRRYLSISLIKVERGKRSCFLLAFVCIVQLQKSAVLQKTIDFIHHLQNTIRKLQDENQQLKESLARGTSSPSPHQCDGLIDSPTFILLFLYSYWKCSLAKLCQPSKHSQWDTI